MNWDKDLLMMMHMREVLMNKKEQMNRKEQMNKAEQMNKKERMSRKVRKVVWEELMALNKVLDVHNLIGPDRVHSHCLVVVVGERLVEEYDQGKDHGGNHNRNCNHHICHIHHNDHRGHEEGDHDHEDKVEEEICLEEVGEGVVYDDHQNHDHLYDLSLFLWVVHVLMNDHHHRLLSY